MKKAITTIVLVLITHLLQAQETCASYQSAFPPPYPSSYPCMSSFLTTYPLCCSTEFSTFCLNLFLSHCPTSANACIVEQCKPTGCSNKPMPFCPSPCPSYSTSTPPPGPNPPNAIDGVLFELFYFDGGCCMDTWDNLCTTALDSIACLVCNDNNPNTIDAASSQLGCTHTPVPTTTTPYVEVKAKVFLEGAYIAGSHGLMNTNLRSAGLLPTAQPFTISPWTYTGTENFASASAIPSNAVDWMMVELRDSKNPSCLVGEGAGILLSNGQLRAASDTSRGVRIDGAVPNTNYYIIVRARNHVALMSAVPVFCSTAQAYDFSYGMQGARGTNQQSLLEDYDPSPTPFDNIYYYGMKAGDFNGDGRIVTNTNPVTSDFLVWRTHASTIRAYNKTDCNFDLMVTYKDYNMCIANTGHLGISFVLDPQGLIIGTCPGC